MRRANYRATVCVILGCLLLPSFAEVLSYHHQTVLDPARLFWRYLLPVGQTLQQPCHFDHQVYHRLQCNLEPDTPGV